ncbi:MAG: hypothetical protein RR668_11930, partial [Algoriella sp.]
MKNYSDQFINTIKLGIENNVSILDQLINWGNENLRYEEKDQFLLKIKNSKNVFHRKYTVAKIVFYK